MYHHGGRLFQQYVIDSAVQTEESKLAYQRNHQSELRAALYSGVTDALRMGDTAGDFGRCVVLASSFVGGPRYIVQQYQDAMAIVRKYGKPDLFVTFTCNPGMSLLLWLINFCHSVVSRAVRGEPPLLYITTSAVSLRLTLSYRRPPSYPCPAWPEITHALLEGQTATDRPDIVSRVFNAKLRALENDLYKNGCFGTAVAWCRVVEVRPVS